MEEIVAEADRRRGACPPRSSRFAGSISGQKRRPDQSRAARWLAADTTGTARYDPGPDGWHARSAVTAVGDHPDGVAQPRYDHPGFPQLEHYYVVAPAVVEGQSGPLRRSLA